VHDYIHGKYNKEMAHDRCIIHKEGCMLDKEALCEKIRSIYPDIGACGIDVNAEYDEDQRLWTVHLTKDQKALKTYLEEGDAEKCMEGIQCVSLGIEIAQLRDSIERMPKDRR